MKTIIMTVLNVSILCGIAFGQEYVSGKVYLPNNDTLTGQIAYQSAGAINKIRFKANGQNTSIEYTAKDINGFEMEEKHFLVYNNKTTPTFYLLLAGGQLNLLFRNEKYYLPAADSLLLLEKERLVYVGNVPRYAPAFKSQLTVLMSQCTNAMALLSKVTFTAPSLSNAIHTYNRCVNSPNAYIYQAPRLSGTWQVRAGGALVQSIYTYYKAYYTIDKYLPNTTIINYQLLNALTQGTSFFASIGYQVPLSSLNKNLKINAGAELRQYSFASVSFKPTYINMPLVVSYDFGKTTNSFRPFIEAGGQVNIRISKPTVTGPTSDSFNYSIPLGLGINIKQWIIGGRYFEFINVSRNKISSTNLFIGYKF